MAKLLYRLGQFSARRAWVVIVVWLLALVGVSTAALTLGGSFSANLTLSGTPAQQVIDDLKKNFPEASRGNAQIVFHAENGKPFTEEQKTAIAGQLTEAATLDGVSGVLNPFETQAAKDAAAQELADSQAKLDAAPAQFAEAQAQIDAGWAQLRQQEQAATAQTQNLTAAQLAARRAQLAAGQAQLAAAKAQLEASQAELDTQKAQLAGQQEQLNIGKALLGAATEYRTVSEDGATAVATVLFDKPLAEVSPDLKTEVTKVVTADGLDGVQVEYSKDLTESLDGLIGPGEVIGLVIAAVTLIVMLGSLIAAGLPLLNALLGVGISVMATLALASFVEMTSTTPALGVMLGLAVGIDYSLFILNRHRKQLKLGMHVRESIARANGTSGSAVFFAGLTVIIALLALNLTGVGFLGVMGNVAAASIVVAVLAALTLTPAISALVGMRVLSRRERKRLGPHVDPETVQHDHVAGVLTVEAVEAENVPTPKHDREVWAAKHPILAVLASIAVLAIVALPVGSMRLGLPDGSSEPVDSTQYQAYKLTADAFGAGQNGLITAVVTFDEPVAEADLTRVESELAADFMKVDDVTAVVVGATSEGNKSILFAVKPTGGPASESTEQVVRDLRALEPGLEKNYAASIGVTGVAAVNIDISQKLADALPLYLGVVLGLSVLLLILVFRSILVPIIATAGFLLSVLASFGAVVAVYQWGWFGEVFDVHDPGPILSFMPTLLIGILFGLAMDYQLFIATGIREAYVHGDTARAAITHGVKAGRAVVIAAAIIMISVFGSFAFGHLSSVRPVGFGLAVGILFDAFVVRLLLVPAFMRLFGKGAWWIPRWLDRVMPDMDVEGAKLERDAVVDEHARHAADRHSGHHNAAL